jgi:hypothetical protein
MKNLLLVGTTAIITLLFVGVAAGTLLDNKTAEIRKLQFQVQEKEALRAQLTEIALDQLRSTFENGFKVSLAAVTKLRSDYNDCIDKSRATDVLLGECTDELDRCQNKPVSRPLFPRQKE